MWSLLPSQVGSAGAPGARSSTLMRRTSGATSARTAGERILARAPHHDTRVSRTRALSHSDQTCRTPTCGTSSWCYPHTCARIHVLPGTHALDPPPCVGRKLGTGRTREFRAAHRTSTAPRRAKGVLPPTGRGAGGGGWQRKPGRGGARDKSVCHFRKTATQKVNMIVNLVQSD